MSSARSSSPVLIVGAGPTGLVLALSLVSRGVAVRIIDRAAGPGRESRATVVHARTLEFYRQFGFADTVVAEGIVAQAIRLRRRGSDSRSKEVLRVGFADAGAGLSPYPFVLSYPQDFHQRLLINELAKLGVTVEWNATLVALSQDDEGVTATVEAGREQITERYSYLCGCDGARSAVRTALGIPMTGGTYDQRFYVADATLSEPMGEDITMNLGEKLLALVMPVRMSGTHRLIGLVPPELVDKFDLNFDDLRGEVEDLIGAHVTAINWFSHYRVHHRVAERFQQGRCFLLGDAGHLHSPVAGQGMNTGIGDAVNLGWKLADVLGGKSTARLLESYGSERLGFARRLVKSTDRAFTRIVAGSAAGAFTRSVAIPALGRLLGSFKMVRRLGYRTLSQIDICYPDSALSRGKQGRVRGGDRLPWVTWDGGDNFAPLRSLDWQLHIYGDAQLPGGSPPDLPIYRFPWSLGADRAGLAQDAIYLVRPDGYVGLAAAPGDMAAVRGYWSDLRI